MDKREIIGALDNFTQLTFQTLAETDAIQKAVQALIDENAALRLENSKLRELLTQAADERGESTNYGRESLEKIYEDGFHVCHDSYGKRRESNEECMLCLSMFDRE